MSQWRSWIDAWWFGRRYLVPKAGNRRLILQALAVLVGSFAFSSSRWTDVVAWVEWLHATAKGVPAPRPVVGLADEIALLGAVLGLLASWFKRTEDLERLPTGRLMLDDALLAALASSSPCVSLIEHGFQVVRTGAFHGKKRHPECILRSAAVDTYLRGGGPKAVLWSGADHVAERMREHAASLLQVLNAQRIYSASKKKPFRDDAKIELLEDPILDRVAIRRGSYFRTFLTNDWSTRCLEVGIGRSKIPINGRNWFPMRQGPDGGIQLLPIAQSICANHIGANTLGVSRDGVLILWRQSILAQHSSDLLAPTGSGSVDWADLEADRVGSEVRLVDVARRAMERELLEEASLCTLQRSRQVIRGTRVLGYFRWLRRGGLPQFVGVTRLDVDVRDFRPDTREVDQPEYLLDQILLPANTPDELQRELRALLSRDNISVPLWAAADALLQSLSSNDLDTRKLLFD